MATVMKQPIRRTFCVVHPLDDQPEAKLKADHLGPMKMTASVKWSLFALRGYLLLMGFMVGFHVIGLSGLLGQSPK